MQTHADIPRCVSPLVLMVCLPVCRCLHHPRRRRGGDHRRLGGFQHPVHHRSLRDLRWACVCLFLGPQSRFLCRRIQIRRVCQLCVCALSPCGLSGGDADLVGGFQRLLLLHLVRPGSHRSRFPAAVLSSHAFINDHLP